MSDLNSNQCIQLKIIGHIKSCYPDKFGIPRQPGIVRNVLSELIINSEWQPEFSLQGLEGYSHMWIHFIFHKNKNQNYHAKVHPPRLNGESIGVFATRSPHRPNPLGLSLVEIKEVQKDRIVFYGGDLVEGTPVIDIKPYLPHFEAKNEARAGWTEAPQTRDKVISVNFEPHVLEKLKNWMDRRQDSSIGESIVQIIQQDPRPLVYKGYEQTSSPYKSQHAFRLYDADVHFKFLSETEAVVIDLLF